MGLTMSFFQVYNRGFKREELQGIMADSFGKRESTNINVKKMLKNLMSEEIYEKMQEELKETQKNFNQIFNVEDEQGSIQFPTIAYDEEAPWLPFFDTNLCEGYIASSKDTDRLSTIFNSPVLAFAVYDSDIVFVSYSDIEKNISYNYAKPNFEEFEELDDELYEMDFPEFLIDLCGENQKNVLMEIWDEEEVFAEDRMMKVLELIQATPIFDEIPEGFRAIHG